METDSIKLPDSEVAPDGSTSDDFDGWCPATAVPLFGSTRLQPHAMSQRMLPDFLAVICNSAVCVLLCVAGQE